MTKKYNCLLLHRLKHKHQKSKCDKDEVFKLVKDTIIENITREMLDETLGS